MKSLIIRQNNWHTVTLYTFVWILCYNKPLYDKRRLQLISAKKHYSFPTVRSTNHTQVDFWMSSALLMWNGRQRSVAMAGWQLGAPDTTALLSLQDCRWRQTYILPCVLPTIPFHHPSTLFIFFFSSLNRSSQVQLWCLFNFPRWSADLLAVCGNEKLGAGWLHPAENTDALLQREEENQSWSHYPLHHHHSPSSVKTLWQHFPLVFF